MSMKRLAVLSAVHTSGVLNNRSGTDLNNNTTNQSTMTSGVGRNARFDSNLHGNVNVLLGGAMLGSVVMVVILVCYCCHKNMNKSRPHEYSPYWRTEPDVHSLEVFTMESHAMCFDHNVVMNGIMDDGMISTLPRPVTPGPPPAYESLLFNNPRTLLSPSDKKDVLSPLGCIMPITEDASTANHTRSILKDDEISQRENDGLPSYEAALKLEAHGYV